MLTARIWRERKTRYNNQVGRCAKCGAMHYPARAVCGECACRDMELTTMADVGKVVTYTIIRTPPPGFVNEVPYVVAILEMDDATRLMAQVVDIAPEEVKTNMRIRLEFRKIQQDGRSGIIAYGHKAVPASL